MVWLQNKYKICLKINSYKILHEHIIDMIRNFYTNQFWYAILKAAIATIPPIMIRTFS